MIETNVYPLYSNARNSVVLRKGEKEVAHYYINLAEVVIPLLSMSYTDCKKAAVKVF